ncbi:hypothetical protein PAECIP111893_00723 [Paenibacillus plantiphilus]|uniref:Lipoprotein n=1 Tax=Paenibacillus plantiphilus TaxID=2905650 RepID=A0ABM9BVH0_9BACL|nr:hypothetical protein [Paenibacillus plantiphilus]CAH1195588.1 hypothetical protein PAECIP111893_00723 [Paenibacillus plantiphilus]
MRRKRYFAIAAISLTVMMFTAGCSEDNGSLTYETDEGKQLTISSKTEVPEGFPSDIPLPAEIKITSSLKSEASGNITVAIETEMPFEEAVKLYQGYADKAGYKESFKIEEAGFYSFSGSTNNELFVFNLQLDQENKKTVTGALVYEKKP